MGSGDWVMTGEYGAMRSDYAGLRGDEGMFQSAEGKGCRDEGMQGLSPRVGRPNDAEERPKRMAMFGLRATRKRTRAHTQAQTYTTQSREIFKTFKMTKDLETH